MEIKPIKITPPEIFSLTENYDETMGTINKLRENLENRKISKILLNKITKIEPEAFLVLAAEMHISHVKNAAFWKFKKMRKIAPSVHRLMVDMGFYELMKQNNTPQNLPDNEFGIQFTKMNHNKASEGIELASIKDVHEKLNDWISENNISEKNKLFEGLGESILNVKHHAYEDKDEEISRWWAVASFQEAKNELKVICYDRGLTIPYTAPKMLGDRIKNIIERADHGIIKAVMSDEGRTSTKKHGRGKGIPRLKEFIDKQNAGNLRIYSRKGMVEYRKNEKSEYYSKKLSANMQGTLIVWSIIISPLDERNTRI